MTKRYEDKNLSELELACYDDESTEFDNNETKDYEDEKCIVCGEKAKHKVVWGIQY